MELAAFPISSPSVIASFHFAGTELRYEIGGYIASLLFLAFWAVVHFSFVMGRRWERFISPVAVERSIPNTLYATPAGKAYHLYGNCSYIKGSIKTFKNALCTECAKRCFHQTAIRALQLE